MILPQVKIIDHEVQSHCDSIHDKRPEPAFLAVKQKISDQDIVDSEQADMQPECPRLDLVLALSRAPQPIDPAFLRLDRRWAIASFRVPFLWAQRGFEHKNNAL
jgi:hypothetical protein